jgi:hypothetical protein
MLRGGGVGNKFNWGILLFIGVVYSSIFIFPNMQGAKNPEMLAIFEIDEYAQFPHLARMLTPGDSLYQTIRNFTVYLHYFYGYPFYFFSAVVVLPIRLIFGADWVIMTPVIVGVLRQLISVLPMIAAVALLVAYQTRNQPRWHSIALFLFLLALPSLVRNNLWWHPDSLAFLFVALTFFFLDRDQLSFGKFFFFAAVSCGLAIGTKHMGEFFVLAIPVYLIWGVVKRKINWQKSLMLAFLFVVVMFAALVVSNPLLLLLQERAEIIAVQKRQFFETTHGSLVANTAFNLDSLRHNLDQLWFIGIALIGMGIGLYREESRLRTALVLCWLLPLTYVIFFVSPQREHYFINLSLPLYLSLGNFFPPIPKNLQKTGQKSVLRQGFQWGMGVLVAVQFGLFLKADIYKYQEALYREARSDALQFNERLEKKIFGPIKDEMDDPLLVYRDWKIYLPSTSDRQVVMNWDFATEPYIRELDPDVILLETANTILFTEHASEIVGNDEPDALAQFYRAASVDELAGYHLILSEDYGIVLVSDEVVEAVWE